MAYNCKVRIIQHLPGVYPKYQPEIGRIYDAEHGKSSKYQNSETCVIDILDKRIALRKGEYEIVEGE